jgi:predicted transcriptional regulator of viral defense system
MIQTVIQKIDMDDILYHRLTGQVLPQWQRLERLLADGSVWRMNALARAGVRPATVRRAVATGRVQALSRGTYRLAAALPVERQTLAEVIARVPHGVICLLSAAEVHGLGDVVPAETWVAVPHGSRTPNLAWPPVRYVRWRNRLAFDLALEERQICGVCVRVTTPARTAVDMLRLSSLVGEQRALRCLSDALASGIQSGEIREIAQRLSVGRSVISVLNLLAGVGATL